MLREQYTKQLVDFLRGRIDNPGQGPGAPAPASDFGPVTVGSHSFDLRKMYDKVWTYGIWQS